MSDPSQPPAAQQLPAPVTAQFRLAVPDFGEAPVVYANFVHATATQHDITMFLGWYATPALSEQPTEPIEVPIKPVMALTIPRELAKSLVALLQASTATGEQTANQPSDTPTTGSSAEEGQHEHE